MAQKNQRTKPIVLPVKFREAKENEAVPEIALYQIGDDGRAAKKIAKLTNGCLSIPRELEKQTLPIALGPNVEDAKNLDADQLIQHYPQQIVSEWRQKGFIEVSKVNWGRWLHFVQCVSGKLSKCYWIVNPSWKVPINRVDIASTFRAIPGLSQPSLSPIIQLKCVPVCYGTVEVYRRVCCCNPWVIIPRLPELIPDILLKIPRPLPDPPPFRKLPRNPMKDIDLIASQIEPAKGVVMEQRVVDDLHTLQNLTTPQEQYDFLNERYYLMPVLCGLRICTTQKIGETTLGPDGTFSFCFLPVFYTPNCYVTYYYKVKQFNGNQDITIYDGAASNAYFTQSEFADLKTFHPQAATCETIDPPVPGEGQPFVMFQAIGRTDTHQLNSPTQNSPNGLNNLLDSNDGLLNQSYSNNCPLGKKLDLLLYIDPTMSNVDAKYYRFSIASSNNMGNPVGGYRILTDGVTWRRFKPGTFPFKIEGIGLGPQVINGTEGLFEIPYLTLSNRWLANQFHYQLNTEDFDNGRYVLKIEIFDSNGVKIRPQGSAGTGTQKGFHFLKWVDPTTTAIVNFDSLIHVLHFDNLSCFGDIVNLRNNGNASDNNCQFLSGSTHNQFSVGFRAYHERGFMLNYVLDYFKGLAGPNIVLETGTTNQPIPISSANPAVSNSATFGTMLAGDNKCSFALDLKVHAKHTNGRSRIQGYDYYDEAAFALEIN